MPVPEELLRQARIGLPVFLTTELWDTFVVPPATASREETSTMRVRRILAVLRDVLAQVPAGREAARFSFQVKNRPLFWDTVHAWVAVHVEQPEGLPALVVGLEKLDEPGAL